MPSRHHRTLRSVFSKPVDYKTLFLGACSLIVLLCGGLYSVWVTSLQQAADSNARTNEKQWERLRELSDAMRDLRVRQDRILFDTNDQERRLRDMEKIILKLK